MASPTLGGELATFIHGITWMNASLPRLNEYMAPLRKCLENVYTKVGGRKKKKYDKYNLLTGGLWGKDEQDAYDRVKETLAQPVLMAHPLAEANSTYCLLTDASHHFYAELLTQVLVWDDTKSVDQQDHRPLVSWSGQFKGAQLHWSTIEKEAYPIIDACERWPYLLTRPMGFRVYTDHANIVHLYNPEKVKPALSVAAVQKIHRWLIILSHYKITHMQHLAGELNVWCDILSRWTNTDYHTLTDKDLKSECESMVKLRVMTQQVRQSSRTRTVPDRLDSSHSTWEKYDANAFEKVLDNTGKEPLNASRPHREEGEKRDPKRTRVRFEDEQSKIVRAPPQKRRAARTPIQVSRTAKFINLNYSPFAPDFEMPSMDIIHTAQTAAIHKAEMDALEDKYPGVITTHLEGADNIRIIRYNGVMYIPNNKELILRILTIAHCGNAGHRSYLIGYKYLRTHVWWPTMSQDAKDFKNTCLNCIKDHTGAVIPRPLGDQLKASHRGQIVSMDYCYIAPRTSTSTHSFVYILVLKDEFSGFVELVPCEHANHEHAVEQILLWKARYGCVPSYIRSDQGSHFMNKVTQNLCRRLGIKQHFTTPYCPWANGSVEIVNKTMIEAFTTIILERNMKPDDWPYLLPIVMSIINGTKSDRLGDHAPLQVFQGVTIDSPLDLCYLPYKEAIVDRLHTLDMSANARIAHAVKTLRESLERIHEISTATKQKFQAMREKSYLLNNGIQHAHVLVDFQIGDYVLVALPTQKAKHKLRAVWRGPFQITQQMEPYVYQVRHLITDALTESHITRIKFYADKEVDMEVPQILNHITNEEFDGYIVDQIISSRLHQNDQQLFVSWKGLHPFENTWEPLREIYDFFEPQLREFLTTLPKSHLLHDVIEQWDT
jgi:transposase InsO family protein